MESFDKAQDEKLLLIDGNAIVYRAYHALPPLTAPDGTVINAMYGFFSMFFTVINELKPEYVIVSFDISKATHRQALYAWYHQNRPQMSDDLVNQFKMLHEALEKMHVPIFEVMGVEADDVIGTLARQATETKILSEKDIKILSNKKHTSSNILVSQYPNISPNIEVIILTGDRDLLQLVNPNVKVLMPVVGVKETVLYDEAKVEEKYGVKSSQFIDYKALIGDPSDGYPGVTGIGPKTASGLLQKYGTFEYLYEHLGELPPKVAEKLAVDAEQAALAKKLATILTDVPVTCRLEVCKWVDFDTKGGREVFEQYGFNTLMKRFANQFQEIDDKKKGEQLGLL